MSIERSKIVSKFAESIGQAKAESTIDRAASELGFGQKDTFSDDEAGQLLDYIAEDDEDVDTLTSVSANTVKTQLVY